MFSSVAGTEGFRSLDVFRNWNRELPYWPYKIAGIILEKDGAEMTKRLLGILRDRATQITDLIWRVRIWQDTHAQDLIEYALMAGFVAVAAGAIMPGVATKISTIFSKVSSVMTAASTQS
jgi:Flp pilus assembly pilin Flp